ncbi:hypothetical protein [Chlorobium limicola]|uniref:Uncharacterized protein n=1 Tax=Chlorobium limicola TaxID=1092 RepID=A0A124G9Y8_CHLLI|nr:hypothetical protein [Chlorobium limicola]KUL30580.1 hypothetical protein ASB62_03890 [Chlorobium limicola]
MDLHVEIRLRKTASRKLTVLEEKVRELPHLKDLEKKRDEKRKHLFETAAETETETGTDLDWEGGGAKARSQDYCRAARILLQTPDS